MKQLRPVKRTSISDEIVEQITDLITHGHLKPGDRIPTEKEFCQRLGVGRTSVREALRSLSGAGVLESHAGNGTFISSNWARQVERAFQWSFLLDRKLVEDLVETRLILEPHTAYLAASKATASDLDVLQQAINGMAASESDLQRYLEHDLRFHVRIAQATQNSILESLLTTIRGYLRVWFEETLSLPARAKLSIKQHQRILDALTEKKAGEARQAMEEHILSSSADLRSRLSDKLRG